MKKISRSKQRGFLYLTTGANGAGKTLNTIKWVRERQIKENREVFYNGRFDMVEGGELDSWKKFEFKDWQTLPDGSLIVVDECHNDIPVRAGSAPPPDAVRMLAEHRKRGFDFYFISQHPQNVDLFVRRLIGSPGWHRHLKRTFGADVVSVLEWSAVNGNCEKTGAGKDAKVSMVPFPKEVYKWYKSASLHTGKKSIPWQVWGLLVMAVLIPTMMYFAYQSLKPKVVVPPGATASVNGQVNPFAPGQANQGNRPDEKKPLTPAEYADSFHARIPGFPQSAVRYDAIQTVTQAPKPAACMHGKRPGESVVSCKCYTQQATPLATPAAVCEAIAAGGFFDDTLQTDKDHRAGVTSLPPAPSASAAAPVPAPVTLAAVESIGYGLRNSAYLENRNRDTASIIKPDLGKQIQ